MKLTVVTKGYGKDKVYEVVDEKGGIKNPYSFSSFEEANEWKDDKFTENKLTKN